MIGSLLLGELRLHISQHSIITTISLLRGDIDFQFSSFQTFKLI